MNEHLVATGDIARMAGVTVDAVGQWVKRGIFPEPAATTSAGKIWEKATVERWLRETGRRK
jgi:DNA-binding transcriptional MerR regulator